MQNPLGKIVQYKEAYDPSLLFAIPRANGRKSIGIEDGCLPFEGADYWRAYECTWLDSGGIPQVAILDITIPCASKNIIESKSLKLYLGSFYAKKFKNTDEVLCTIQGDIAQKALSKDPIILKLQTPTIWDSLLSIRPPEDWFCIDQSLKNKKSITNGIIYSNLLRSVCPVTGQPDYATAVIAFDGTIKPKELLDFIISMRSHPAFHEQCCEQLYLYVQSTYSPSELSVLCAYTRRGGIEICPVRSTSAKVALSPIRFVRQ